MLTDQACSGAAEVNLIEIFYWPSYSNPYQSLFYAAAAKGVRAEPGSIEMASARLDEAPSATVCFHVHWLNAVTRSIRGHWRARFAARDFLAKVAAFRRKGGVVVWTVHNLLSHDAPFPALDLHIGRTIADAADIVLLHGRSIQPAARALFPRIAGKEITIGHGNYIGTYPNSIGRSEARAALGIGTDATVLLCLGAVRPYKGIIELITALGSDGGDRRGLELVVAGRPSGVRGEDLEEAAARAHVRLRHDLRQIAPEEMQIFLNAADWMMLPYRRVLTSGSAVLALSFGLPIIAPQMGLLPELLQPGREGLLYPPNTPDGLRRVLSEALGMPADRHADMRAAAMARAQSLDWSQGQETLALEIRKARSTRPAFQSKRAGAIALLRRIGTRKPRSVNE